MNTTTKLFNEVSMTDNVFKNDSEALIKWKDTLEKDKTIVCPLCNALCEEGFLRHKKMYHKVLNPKGILSKLINKKDEMTKKFNDIFILRYLFQQSIKNPIGFSPYIQKYNAISEEIQNEAKLSIFNYYEISG